MKNRRMKIIDIHAHVFPDPIARKASDSVREFYGLDMDLPDHAGTVDELLELSEEAGISHSCIHSVAVTPRSVDSINRFIAGVVKEQPDRLTGFGAIHPGREDPAGLADEVQRMGLKGFKIHPDMQRFALDSPEAMEMFGAIEGKLPIIIHTGDSRFEYSRPRQMKNVLDAFPNLVCVCAHLGGWSEWDDAQALLAGYENMYVDTSSSLYAMTAEKARRLIRGYSRERVLFGTDFPMWTPRDELNRFLQLNLSDGEQERILWRNAEELLGMKE